MTPDQFAAEPERFLGTDYQSTSAAIVTRDLNLKDETVFCIKREEFSQELNMTVFMYRPFPHAQDAADWLDMHLPGATVEWRLK